MWQTSLHNPDFSEYANICGAKGFRVAEKADLEGALKAAFDSEGPALVEILADPDLI